MSLLRMLTLLAIFAPTLALRSLPAISSPRSCLSLRRNTLMQTGADGEEPTSSPPAPDAKAAEPAPAYSTVYDDDGSYVPPKDPLSSSMRARLIREQQSMGADPNKGNPFLLVFGAVGVFVVLGFFAVNS
uniref:Uncharacterized protein n=1 Tax=Coccolithus braarudii TaxID=221442 RepID=A0A7S0Q1Q0_9EUKA